MNPRLYIICFICIAAMFALTAPVSADGTATVHGGVYSWDTFEPLENAVIEVNSTPSQSMVAKYGLYSFELVPGTYKIAARYYQNSTLVYSAEETITIEGEGNYVRDLLLLPVYADEFIGEGNSSTERASFPIVNRMLVVSTLFFLLIGGYWLSTKHKKADENIQKGQKTEHIPRKGPSSLSESTKMTGPSSRPPDKGVEPEVNQGLVVEADISPKNEETSPTAQPVIEPVKELITNSETERETAISVVKPPVTSEPEIPSTESATASEVKMQENNAPVNNIENIPEQKTISFESEKEEGSQEASFDRTSSSDSENRFQEIEASVPKKKAPLPSDLQEVMDIIRGQGGRITQKNLRSKLKCSEGKVSLMLADLERRELIEKFKMGRGNVVVVKYEER